MSGMNSYKLGQVAVLKTNPFLDETGSPIDPDTFSFIVKPPGQPKVFIPTTDPLVTRLGVGVYTCRQKCTLPGVWSWGVEPTGNGETGNDSRFFVEQSEVLT